MSRPKLSIDAWLGVLSLLIICLISLANVVVRYITDKSFAFTEEFSVFLMVVLTLAGAAVAARRNEHIRISLLENKLGPAAKRCLYVLQWLGAAIVLSLIVWYGGLLTYEEYTWESTSPSLGLPTWWYLIWLPGLSIVIFIRLTQNFITRMRQGDDTTAEETAL